MTYTVTEPDSTRSSWRVRGPVQRDSDGTTFRESMYFQRESHAQVYAWALNMLAGGRQIVAIGPATSDFEATNVVIYDGPTEGIVP